MARTLQAVVHIVSGTALLALITVGEGYVAANDRTGFAAAGLPIMAQRD